MVRSKPGEDKDAWDIERCPIVPRRIHHSLVHWQMNRCLDAI